MCDPEVPGTGAARQYTDINQYKEHNRVYCITV